MNIQNPLLPNSIEISDIRRAVQADFSDGETPEQILLRDKDTLLSNDQLMRYINHQCLNFEENYRPLDQKGRGQLEHKDFYQFITKCDVYLDSPDYRNMINELFGHFADNRDMRLAHKYHMKLQSSFLSYKEDTSREPVGEPSQSHATVNVESDASLSAIRHLAGMCFAKTRYRQCTTAMNNLHKVTERSKVLLARRKADVLQKHIVTQDHRNTVSSVPDTLQMTNRNQNLRQGLTHITDEVFKFFVVLDKDLSVLLQMPNLRSHRGNLFVHVEHILLRSVNVEHCWKELFQ